MKETTPSSKELTENLTDLSTKLEAKLEEEQKGEKQHKSHAKRIFTTENINDLIYWGIHFFIVAISLTIVWTRINNTNVALSKLIIAQAEETKNQQAEVQRTKETLAAILKQVSEGLLEARNDRTEQLAIFTRMAQQSANDGQTIVSKIDDIQAEFDAKISKIQTDVADTLHRIQEAAGELNNAAITGQKEAESANANAAYQGARASRAQGALATKTKQLRRADRYIRKQRDKNFFQRLFTPNS